MKIKEFKNGAYASFEKCGVWYVAQARDSGGNLIDKMRCDTYRGGMEYYRAFCNLAKQA